MKEVLINKDILDFLKGLYFGNFDNVYQAASRRAYRDFNRTLRFNKIADSDREKYRESVDFLLENAIKSIDRNKLSHEYFDKWHEDIAKRICDIYTNNSIVFYYGQAQKWINMTFKYLYTLKPDEFAFYVPFLHIAIDNIVIDIAKEEFEIAKPKKSWSKWSKEEYLKYQKTLRDNISEDSPFNWEYLIWLRWNKKDKTNY